VQGLEQEGLQDEEIERALQEIGLVAHGVTAGDWNTLTSDNSMAAVLSDVKVW
jgi:hypothetical protein